MSETAQINEKGFTLVEMVMSILILAILAGIAGPLLGVTFDAMELRMERVGLEESANLALSRVSREIRDLRNDQSVVTAAAGEFQFVNVDNAQIRYRLSGTSLMRTEGSSAEAVLAYGLQASGLTFRYYDDNGNVISSPSAGLGTFTNIRTVQVEMVFENGTHVLPVQVQIRPRNLRHVSDYFT